MIGNLRALVAFLLAVTAVCAPVFLLAPVSVDAEPHVGSWTALASSNLNAFHFWRSDPFVRFFASRLSLPAAAFQMVIMLCGTWLAIRQHSAHFARKPALRWLVSAVPCLAVLSFVGLDRFVIGSLAWMPLLSMMLFALLNATRASYGARVLPLWVMALFVSVQSSASANQASVCTALAALFIARYFWERSQDRRALKVREALALATIALGPALWVAVTAPTVPLPAYPQDAHVVPESGTSLLYHALVGPAYPVLTVDRTAAAALYRPGSALLLAVSLALLVTAGRGATPNQKRLLLGTAAATVCLFLDSALPYDLSLIAPLATLSRLLPWGTVVPLVSVAVGLVAWLAAVAALSHPSRVVLTLACAASLLGSFIGSAELTSPSLAAYLAPSASPEVRRLVASPSSSVIRHFLRQDSLFLTRLEHYRQQSSAHFVDLFRQGGSYSLVPSVPLRDPTQPGRPRLSTGIARQVGGEVCTAKLPQEGLVSGIEVSPGRNWGDFPRGMVISAGSCDRASAKHVVTVDDWQGPLLFTADGFPYWGRHHFVKVLFPQAVSVQCLFVEQTGSAPYDWAVDQVKVLSTHP